MSTVQVIVSGRADAAAVVAGRSTAIATIGAQGAQGEQGQEHLRAFSLLGSRSSLNFPFK